MLEVNEIQVYKRIAKELEEPLSQAIESNNNAIRSYCIKFIYPIYKECCINSYPSIKNQTEQQNRIHGFFGNN